MPKKPKNKQQSNSPGVNTKQRYSDPRGNGQFYCVNHGSNNSHNTNGCQQRPNKPNANSNQGQKVTCTDCGKFGHVAANCRSNKSQTGQKPKDQHPPPPPYTTNDPNKRRPDSQQSNNYYSASVVHAAENYCGHCNVQGHNPTTCTNTTGMYDAFRSPLYCLQCRAKGHLIDDCNNPLSTQCTRCFRKGHSSPDCKLNPDRDAQIRLALAARNTHQRFVWNNPDIAQHPSQQAEAEYEAAKKNAAITGVRITSEDDLRYQRNIFLASHVFGANPIIEAAKALGADVHNYTISGASNTYTPPHAQPRTQNATSASAANATAKKNQLASNLKTLEKMRREGFSSDDIKKVEEMFKIEIQEKTDFEKQIAAKIAQSYCYPLALVNNWIRQNEGLICTTTMLPQSRMNELKWLMMQGGSIFRDPRAMKALFDRNIPRCNKCNKNGVIVDRWFNIISPAIPKAEILNLEDLVDWGLFVVLECTCSREPSGYEFLLCSDEILETLPDHEK